MRQDQHAEESRGRPGHDGAAPPTSPVDTLQKVLDDSRAGFQLTRVPLSATDDWSITDGALQHRSKGFFNVVGVRMAASDDGQVMLYQPQGALNGLVTARMNGERHFLLQARAEPGNVGEAQYGPTLQSTPANYLRMHGGAPAPYIESFLYHDLDTVVLSDTTQLDLGERYLYKTKRVIVIETPQPVEVRPSFVWASRDTVYGAVSQSAFLNTDLRSAFSLSRWSAEEDDGELTPRARLARQSLAAPIRPDVLGALHAAVAASPRERARFCRLEELANWEIGDWGISERSPEQRLSVGYFELRAAYREMGRWIQPLIESHNEGHAILACREGDAGLEVFVRVLPERGLTTGAALAPSYLRYPGGHGEPPEWLSRHASRVWAESIESDEGGRFYRDVSRLEIIGCDSLPSEPPAGSGAWLRLSELEHCLATSNLCSIQLRCIASHLLSIKDV